MTSMKNMSPLEMRLAKAKTALVLEHPFIGTIALKMPFVLDDTLNPPTACTNGQCVRFHPDFVAQLNDDQLKFLVAHECLHPMLEHPYRRGERNPRKFNRAGDYVINDLLVKDSIGTMPEAGLHDPQLWAAGGGTTDGIYNILPDEEGDDGTGPVGSGMDNCQDSPGSPADKEQAHAEMKVAVAQASQAARLMGSMSDNMEAVVNEILNPKVDWREVLMRFVEKCKNDTRTWARPARRFLVMEKYFPSITGEALGPLVFGVDCSGSCWNDIPQFANEVRVVHEDHKPRELHVMYFDTKVSHTDSFTKDDTFHMEGHGGGGTAFSPIFAEIADLGIEPVACIVLTDLCCNDFGPEPEYPVLWVSNHSDKAAWGEVVMM